MPDPADKPTVTIPARHAARALAAIDCCTDLGMPRVSLDETRAALAAALDREHPDTYNTNREP